MTVKYISDNSANAYADINKWTHYEFWHLDKMTPSF